MAEEREASARASRRVLQLVLDTFQRRWARLLEVMYAADLEAYAGSGGGEAAPISLTGFREVTDISSEVVKLCASDGRAATSLVSILQVLGKHLLKVCIARPPNTVLLCPVGLCHPARGLLYLQYCAGLGEHCVGTGTPSTFFRSYDPVSIIWRCPCMAQIRHASKIACLMHLQGHANGLQLQLELVLKAEQWVPCAADVSAQRFLDRLFEVHPNGGTGSQDDLAGIHSSTPNGSSQHTPHGSTAQQPGDSTDASAGREAESASLATALESAVNSEQAARRLQGLPLSDDRQQGATEPVEAALHVGDARFVVVGSAGLLLQHIEALLAFGHTSLALRYEMGSRIAALVRAFDTNSQELLLGAAAISSAGLRSITARHMGVCSQCLLLLEVVLPRLRYMALEGLPAAQVASLATIYESVAEVWLTAFL